MMDMKKKKLLDKGSKHLLIKPVVKIDSVTKILLKKPEKT